MTHLRNTNPLDDKMNRKLPVKTLTFLKIAILLVFCAPAAADTAQQEKTEVGSPAELPDTAEAKRLACSDGDTLACTLLDFSFGQGQRGILKKYVNSAEHSKSREAIMQACNDGNAAACVALGDLYRFGVSPISQDYNESIRLYREGCSGGHFNGCISLGMMYSTGVGVEIDLAEAHSLWKQSCDGGALTGCINLGILYERGTGVNRTGG